jgi:hypothetical protein
VRISPVVVADEEDWPVQAALGSFAAYITLNRTVYAILRGRGFDEPVLGSPFAGILVRDN